METLRLMGLLALGVVMGRSVVAQPQFAPGDSGLGGPRAAPPPVVTTFSPSAAGGETGIAVGVLAPLKARYAKGAPVVIHVPGGVDSGATEGRPECAGLGFVEIRFAFPGGGRGDGTSGGTYDYRGPDCLRALADVIRFATGRLADKTGRRLQDLLPDTAILTSNIGLVGSSHGGNACGMVMATHGEEFPDLAFYASMESPYGIGSVNVELGGRAEGLNPAYNPETGVLDLSKLAWSNDLPPASPRRPQGAGTDLKGALFFDLDGDGRFAESKDFPANVPVQDLGHGPKAWYSPRLIQEAETRRLYGTKRPDHVPSLAESTEYWGWRDAAGSIAAAVRKCPAIAVIVYANEQDHVQAAPDHPHILAQVEGFRQAGAKFVRLNPDRAYVERILASGGPAVRAPQRPIPDNDAGVAWDRDSIRGGLEPQDMPMPLFMQAAVCELADRVQARNWSKSLDAVLYPDAPWARMGAQGPGAPAGQRPALRPGKQGGRPPLRNQRPLDSAAPRPPSESQAQSLRQEVAEDAGSPGAPLLFCIGVHVEPFGATVSAKANRQVGQAASPRPGPKGAGQGGGASRPRPSYEIEGMFSKHLADLRTLADIVERHGGKLTAQVQTPFSRKLAESDNPLLRDFERRGHEIALHFHEDAHLGRGSETLSVSVWSDVMREEMEWLKKAGATRVRYWSGGNLYPGVLEAASQAGLEVMSDYKNPRTQRDDERLLAVNPWRPAAGPSEADLAPFATHGAEGRIIFLPNGVFERADHSAMRRSADTGGDYAYFDALTRGLELSLRAARPDRVNVFHITVHAGEFRGGQQTARPFGVIDDWLAKAVDPLVKAGKVKWATFSEMADAFKAWEKANPGAAPRVPNTQE